MANPNPHKARLAKKRYREVGGLPALRALLWRALLEAEAVLEGAGADEAELKLKAIHAISQAGGQYARLLEIGELEARLTVVERALGGQAA